MIIAGFFLLILVYLGYSGVITINFEKLLQAVGNLLSWGQQAADRLTIIISSLPLTGSFILGLILGFKVG